MIALAEAASILYDLLDQQPVDRHRYQLLVAWGEQEIPLFDIDPAVFSNLLASQPKAPIIRKEWRKVFRSPNLPADEQSRLFIQTVISALVYWGDFVFENIETSLSRSVCGGPTDYHTSRIMSNFGWQVQLTVEGSGAFNCVHQTIRSVPGDVFIFAPEGLMDFGRASDCSVWAYRWVFFQPQEQWQNILRLQEVAPGIYHVHIGRQEDYNDLVSLFEKIGKNRYSSRPFTTQLATNLLEQLLIRCQQAMPGDSHCTWDARVEKALQYLRDNYALPLVIEDVADAAGISSSRLANLFKQQTGRSVLAYRDDIRMSRACHLLTNSNLTVTKVAGEVGYLDSQYFSRQFKKHLGESPRSYRNRLNYIE